MNILVVDQLGGLVGPWNTMKIKKDPNEILRGYLKSRYPDLGEEELEAAFRRLRDYLILAGKVARENLRKEKGKQSGVI